MQAKSSLGRIYGVPAVIAVLSLAGLIAALFGNGVWDLSSWLGLSAPVLATIWAVRARRLRR